MATSDLAIRIATVLDSKGLNKAQKGISGLESSVNKLAKSVGAIFAVDRIVAFGKATAQAFMDDQKSAALLSNTLKNLSLGFADANVKTFIDQLALASGTADDELRPSLQRLLQATKSYTLSQDLLKQALDFSRGSSQSLETVVLDLSNAYVGNNKGLKKYTLGLSAAELKTASFDEVLAAFNKNFSGANAAYLKTYAGQMDVLTVSAAEAKEVIGKGLIDSLALLSGDNSVKNLATQMQSLADYTADVTYGLASLTSKLKTSGGSLNWEQLIPAPIRAQLEVLDRIAKYGDVQQNKKLENPSTLMFKADMANMRLNNIKAKDTKKILDSTKKLTAEQKKQMALKQAGLTMDLTTANLIAALKGNLSDEDRKRAELQLALQTDNVTEAQRLTKEIALSQGLSITLANTLSKLPAASNPFAGWKGYLDEIELQAKRIAAFGSGGGTGGGGGGGGSTTIPDVNQVLAEASAGFANANQQIKVLVEGGDEVTSLMRFKIQEAAQSGSTTNWSQTVGAWDR